MNIDKAAAILKTELIVKPVRVSINASVNDKVQTITHISDYAQNETLRPPAKLRGSPDIEIDSFHIYIPRKSYENIKASLGLTLPNGTISVDIVVSTNNVISTPSTLSIPENQEKLSHFTLNSIDPDIWVSFGYVNVKPAKDYFGTFYIGVKRMTLTQGGHSVYIDSDGTALHPYFSVRKQVFPPRYLLHQVDSTNHIESTAFVGTHLSFEPVATKELLVPAEFEFYDKSLIEVAPRLNIDAVDQKIKIIKKASYITSSNVKHPHDPASAGAISAGIIIVIVSIAVVGALAYKFRKRRSIVDTFMYY